jgi:signal transduction histidine kinase
MVTTPLDNGPPIRVLLVDDDRDDYSLTREILEEIPGGRFRLDWVSTYDAALEAICRGEHEVYLIDYRLGAKTGLELMLETQARGCFGPMILLTGQGELEVDQAAMRARAADYLEKSRLDPTLLERSIRYALQKHRTEAELERKVEARTLELQRINKALQQEIAERHRAEEALKEADRRKDEFLATLAHELRNPLAPIRNALEIMRLASGNPKAIEQARVMTERQVTQMVRLIDDLLDVSRITRGKLRLDLDAILLGDVIESALEISRPVLEKAGLTLHVGLPPAPVPMQGDRVRLAQVFSNLLNNAAKYTEPGGSVHVTVEAGESIVVRVRDTGVGVPAEMLPRLFELFTQVDRSLNRSQGGLGIGLALVRRLTEMHGGTVEATSGGPGKGSEFVVRLPRVVPKAGDAKQ